MKLYAIIPGLLLVYLGIMAYIGKDELAKGNYLYYFGLIGATLVCIVFLFFFLRSREKAKERKRKDRNS